MTDAEITEDESSDSTGDDTRTDTCQKGREDKENLCRSICSYCKKPCLPEGEESSVTQEEIEAESKDREEKDMDGHVEDILSRKCGKKEKE